MSLFSIIVITYMSHVAFKLCAEFYTTARINVPLSTMFGFVIYISKKFSRLYSGKMLANPFVTIAFVLTYFSCEVPLACGTLVRPLATRWSRGKWIILGIIEYEFTVHCDIIVCSWNPDSVYDK